MLPIDVTEEGIVTEAKELQPEKALSRMLLPDTIVTCVRLEQPKYDFEAKSAGALSEVGLTPLKTSLPIDVTEEGIVTEAKELQPEKAESPIDVTEEGIAIEAKELQP